LKRLVLEIPETEIGNTRKIDMVTSILVRTFSFIRSYIADQLELFSVSFFQLPMLRRLESSMQEIQLSPEVEEQCTRRAEIVRSEIQLRQNKLQILSACISDIRKFVASSY
jgi:hypothetical protein